MIDYLFRAATFNVVYLQLRCTYDSNRFPTLPRDMYLGLACPAMTDTALVREILIQVILRRGPDLPKNKL